MTAAQTVAYSFHTAQAPMLELATTAEEDADGTIDPFGTDKALLNEFNVSP